MTDRDRITQVVYEAIDELNHQRSEVTQLEKSSETVLFGNSGQLDSLGLVNLSVAVEDNFENQFGYSISVTDERARSHETNPFHSVGTLIDYICGLVEKRAAS